MLPRGRFRPKPTAGVFHVEQGSTCATQGLGHANEGSVGALTPSTHMKMGTSDVKWGSIFAKDPSRHRNCRLRNGKWGSTRARSGSMHSFEASIHNVKGSSFSVGMARHGSGVPRDAFRVASAGSVHAFRSTDPKSCNLPYPVRDDDAHHQGQRRGTA